MVPFKETINTKQELIEACKKGFEDYSNRRISKNDFCMYFGFTHGEAITKFYEGDYEQLLIDGGFNSGSGAYFQVELMLGRTFVMANMFFLHLFRIFKHLTPWSHILYKKFITVVLEVVNRTRLEIKQILLMTRDLQD